MGTQKTATLGQTLCKFGGAMRDRTADLFAASEALSQLSYSPVSKRARMIWTDDLPVKKKAETKLSFNEKLFDFSIT